MTTTIELIERRLSVAESRIGEGKELFLETAQRLRELDKPDCVWTNSDSDEEFETQCGNAFTFIDGGIKENDCKFCQYCGGAVKEST